MLRFKSKIHKAVADGNVVEVIEMDGVRSLYLGSTTIQSSMRVRAPYALELAYSRGMMCFLLFTDKVRHALSIGLGGGSVQKYIWKNCPEIKQTIVEISPQVIATARHHFFVPEDDARFDIVVGDGLEYLAASPNSADVLIIDAFDGQGIPPDFCTQDFFDHCEMTLTDEGIFVINLWGSDKNFDVYLRRIEQSFENRVLMLPTGKPGNIVVFGFRRLPDLRMAKLRNRAALLEKSHTIEFTEFLEKLYEHNLHNHQQLLLETT